MITVRRNGPRPGRGEHGPRARRVHYRALWDVRADSAAAEELSHTFYAAVAAAVLGDQVSGSSRREARRVEVLQHVRERLADRNLSATSVGRALGMAPRTLHGLFHGQQESFAAVVRRLRLERSAALLRDPGVDRTVTEIGASVGMADPSAFSRAFRRQFGESPSDLRVRARTAQAARAS